jgi:hypothetical protein
VDAWQLGTMATAWVVENYTSKNTRILELGCGKGTVERAKIYDVLAVEHDNTYIADEVKSILAPIVENGTSTQHNELGWYDAAALESLRGQTFDLLIIDGPPGEIGRTGVLSVPWLIKLSRCILVDDTHRASESHLAVAIEAMLMNVEREELIEESEWGLRKSTILRWSENRADP